MVCSMLMIITMNVASGAGVALFLKLTANADSNQETMVLDYLSSLVNWSNVSMNAQVTMISVLVMVVSTLLTMLLHARAKDGKQYPWFDGYMLVITLIGLAASVALADYQLLVANVLSAHMAIPGFMGPLVSAIWIIYWILVVQLIVGFLAITEWYYSGNSTTLIIILSVLLVLLVSAWVFVYVGVGYGLDVASGFEDAYQELARRK
jgi:hypothetical protein